MKKKPQRLTVETPKGKFTGSDPMDGFQIISIKEFNAVKAISKEIKTTSHKLYFDLIIIITKGEGSHTIDFENYTYSPGTIFTIKNGQFHAWDNNSNKDGYLLFLTKDFYVKMGVSMDNFLLSQGVSSFINPKLNLGENTNQYLPIVELINTQHLLKLEQNKVLKNLVISFLSIIEREYFNKHTSIKNEKFKSLFQNFHTLIEIKTPLPSRNADYYSKHFGLSFKSLNELSKKMSNYTAKAFIDMIIVTRAKRALTINSQDISQIAFDLSFAEVGNFSKFFKKNTGFTPNQFRKLQNPF